MRHATRALAVTVLAACGILATSAVGASAANYTCALSLNGPAAPASFSLTGPASCRIDGAATETGTLDYAGSYSYDRVLGCFGPEMNGSATLRLPDRQRSFLMHVSEFGVYAELYAYSGLAGSGLGVVAPSSGCLKPSPVTLTAEMNLVD